MVGSFEEAADTVADTAEMDRSDWALSNLGWVLARIGQPDRAEAIVAELEQRFPKNTLVQSCWIPHPEGDSWAHTSIADRGPLRADNARAAPAGVGRKEAEAQHPDRDRQGSQLAGLGCHRRTQPDSTSRAADS